MTNKTLQYLDYLKLLDILKRYALTPFTEESITNLRPLHTLEAIKERQNRIEAVLDVIRWEGRFPLSDVPDIRSILKRVAVRNAVLEEKEFLSLGSFLKACEDIANFLKRAYNKKPFIEEIIHRINPLVAAYRRIAKTINPEGFIEDTASYDLSRTRADLFALRDRTRKRLERLMEKETVRPILQDVYISLRNGRYVIPLKPNFNEVFQGIVHDYSHSLKTSFVEPIEVVELNNSINILEKEEKEEEKRILNDLTGFVRGSAVELEMDLQAVEDLDFFHSLAVFGLEFDCVRPDVGEDGLIEIRGARNPFISLSKKGGTIPIDIVMETEKRAMIISGPNAGGKTAALKTIGLLCLMAQSGIYIPAAERPKVPMFANVFAIIGDEQDITMELSSFTAHMNIIKDLYGIVRGDELILIDEIGGNTEPQEASALSMGIIDTFVEKGCRVVVTTHLNLIKAYGYAKPFAINVATAFDSETMKPLYRLVYGTAGYSNAINVAKNIQVQKEIIDRSYEYLGKQEYMLNDLISTLELGKRRVEDEQQELKRLREELQARLDAVKEKRDEYFKKVEEKCDAKLAELERELEDVRRELAKKERSAVTKGKEKVRYLRQRFVKTEPKIEEDIRVGDYVKVRSLGVTGHVVAGDKETKSFEVVMGNVRTKVDAALLQKIPKPKESRNANAVRVNAERVPAPEINVIGLRVEEALTEVDRFLDRAIVQGIPQVKIVHGIGTGRLMNAVRDHLSGAGYIKNLRRDETNSGVTIIDLS
ncbi:MAG: Endonuclease MutS2 [Syntrophorhabdus sp. PtaU1.Bin153]|nr:MAG: Endonuclease MutS2 [Syntrophorhabdus sp. PtaU1.Bin153]